MLCRYTSKLVSWAIFMVLFILTTTEAYASHAQGADLTYQCLGGNQYQFTLKFYRDCSGANAPNNVSINASSASCNQNFSLQLAPIPNTGIEVTPICPSQTTTCTNGNNPGVREYIYTGTSNVPPCSDWVFSFTLCCRNAAISTINAPGSENIYVEARLDNLNFPCNSSPTFTNRPVPYICVGQNFCFNHGASDPDGDLLVYALIPPATGPLTTVTYLNPYTANQPIASNPAVTFNTQTGDICMTPTMLQVTVMAVRVEEWRNNQLVGSVVRDIQVQTQTCTNVNPSLNGINGTGVFVMNACAGTPISFFTNSADPDQGQTITLTWNNGIPNGNFSVSGGPLPTGTFTWTPMIGDAGPAPHCFTVTVQDDNCPIFGSQTYSFCIYVSGVSVIATGSNATCISNSGSASTSVTGIPPYTYQWSNGATTASISNLSTGTYSVMVTNADGCTGSASVVINAPAQLNLSSTQNNVNCFGMNNGSATVAATGGNGPYTYQWSNGPTTPSASNLASNNYFVTVTDVNGCTATINIFITQPAQLQNNLIAFNDVTCYGGSNGSATVQVIGGTPPYSYNWNTTPPQNNQSANNLGAGTYQVNVTDANNCTVTLSVSISQPQPITAVYTSSMVSCYGGNNGSAFVTPSGGNPPYNYSWNTNPAQFTQSAGNLSAGTYLVTVTDQFGCTGLTQVMINQPTPLVATVQNQQNVSCNGGSNATATGNGSGGTFPYSYTWSTSPVQTAATATGLSAGTYTLTVTDDNGCAAVTTVIISQPAPLISSASGADTICPNQSTIVNASANGGTGPYTYFWNQGLGAGQSHTVNPATTTLYSVVITDANGCTSGPNTVLISVWQLSPVDITILGSPNVCSGQNGWVASTVNGFTGPVIYTWNNNLGNGPGPINVYPTATTTYVVTVTNTCGVTATSSFTIIVNPIPQITLAPVTSSGCDQITVMFSDSSGSNFGCTYNWDFGDGYFSTAQNPTHNYTQTGVYYVTVTLTSPWGCIGTGTTWVAATVNPSAIAQFSANPTITTILEPTVTFTNQSQNASSWFWDFGDMTTSTVQNPVHTYAKGIYQVMLAVTNAAGCPDTTWLTIRVEPEFTFYIPNAFTPDGDNLNDEFLGKGEEITSFKMEIFDRWGALIFQTENLTKGWDGRANGGSEIAQEDVYVYRIVLRDHSLREHQFNGHVSLIK